MTDFYAERAEAADNRTQRKLSAYKTIEALLADKGARDTIHPHDWQLTDAEINNTSLIAARQSQTISPETLDLIITDDQHAERVQEILTAAGLETRTLSNPTRKPHILVEMNDPNMGIIDTLANQYATTTTLPASDRTHAAIIARGTGFNHSTQARGVGSRS